ncbi:arylmalonate decarboxylase [Streptomyces sp. NPDC092296]|uniref:maleate cis-trans isomerase family protein n=1 Tax=Streptomyces sp. NPDC092296 TaxID=3366012 RepID=UPI0037F36788
MTLQSAAKLGLVVPSGNAAAEPEVGCLVRPALNVHTSRFPHLTGQGLRARLDTYNEILPSVIAGFGRLALDAVVVACSGSHYLLGPDEDRAFCDKLGAEAGAPVASSTIATLDTCADLGLDRVTLVSPYEPWLTELSRQYWEAAGITVERVIKVRAGDRFSPYDVTTEELVTQVLAAEPADDEALLLTGTGMFTFEALREIGAGNDRTLLTSNVCAARWARRKTGAAPVRGDQPWLLRRLADQAGDV